MKALWPALLLAACAPAGAEGGTTWHVDFANGNDSRDGRTPATAWKHAPGDEAATGGPAGVTLKPGDRVLFRAGVAYRGTFRPRAEGTAEAPIVYAGQGWGPGMAILDGADPVRAARPCRDPADCGGAGNWQQLTRIEFDPPASERIVLFGRTGLYFAAMVPALPEPFFGSDRHNFAVVPKSERANLEAGRLRSRELAAAAASGGMLELALWVKPNRVERRPVLGLEGDTIRFDPSGLRFYETRDSAAALAGSIAGLGAPGSFAVLGPGLMVAALRPGESPAELAIGSGRMGFVLGRHTRHLRIEGFAFRNFSGSSASRREGRAITSLGPGAEAIEVVGNRFGPAWYDHGSGMVHLQGTAGFRFAGNWMEDIFGAGFRAGGNRPSDLVIEGNRLHRIGKTAIGLLGVDRAVVRNNILTDVRGVHGNGITLYTSNRQITVEGNCVTESSRPLTFSGDRDPATANSLTIRNNILVSSPTGQAAINAWGSHASGVVIEGNLLAGPRTGLLLNSGDVNVVVRGNAITRLARAEPPGQGWVIENNRTGLAYDAAARVRVTDAGCRAPPALIRLETVRRAGPAAGG